MKTLPYFSSRGGFTLVEVVTAATIVTMAMAMMMSAYLASFRAVGGDSLHVSYIDEARIAQQRITNIIQSRAAVGVADDRLNIFQIEGEEFVHSFTLRFEDGDDDAATLEDNWILLDPNLEVEGDETVLCRMVSPLGTNEMFRMCATRRGTAEILFHVGEVTPDPDNIQHGRAYHGIEIRLAATPRNTNLFLQ